MIVALDGPAGVGKSSVSRMIAEKTGLFYLNSGNFYRGVTLSVLEKGLDPGNEQQVIEAARLCSFEIRDKRLFLDGTDVEDRLHSDAVDEWVAQHSAIIPVRKIVNEHLRRIGKNLDLIAEGRDITTVVFPDADVKVFLDASVEIRAGRRHKQGVSDLSVEEHVERIQFRDTIDKNKPFGSLKVDEGALYLDTSDLTIDEVCAKVLQKIYDAKH
jgi:cytidylate kinase